MTAPDPEPGRETRDHAAHALFLAMRDRRDQLRGAATDQALRAQAEKIVDATLDRAGAPLVVLLAGSDACAQDLAQVLWPVPTPEDVRFAGEAISRLAAALGATHV